MTLSATADLHPDFPGRILVKTPYRLKDCVKAVPGARWDTATRVWTVPQSWPSCLALRAEFDKHLTIGPDLLEWAKPIGAVKKYLRTIRPEVEGISIDTTLPGMGELYPHQKIDAKAIQAAERYMLMNGTGTGKTRSALAGLSLLATSQGDDDIFPALIAAPLSMLRTWEQEILGDGDEIEGFFPDAKVSVVTGTPAKVRKALEPGSDFYIICWDSLRRYSRLSPYPSVKMTDTEKEEKEINDLGLRTFIGDEIHRAKNPKSKRTRAAWYIAHGCQYRIGLTGTPMQDTPEDLYGVLHLLAPEEYPSKTGFMERFVEFDWNIWGGRDVGGIRPEREDEWESNFDTRTRRMTKEMVLDFLPPKVETVRWVELPTKHRKAYEQLEETYMVELEESVLTVDNQLVLAGRLLQLANSMGEIKPYTVTDKETGEEVVKQRFVMTEDSSPKVDSFLSDYTEGDYDDESIVVFSDSRQLIELCAEALRKKGIEFVAITGDVTGDDRKAAMDTFQAGGVPICLLTRAGGEGITLTEASTMVRLVRSWSLTVHQQVEDRVHRIGSEKHDSIRYVDYIVEDTVEAGQLARLGEKEARSKEVLRDGELLAMLKAKKAAK